MPKIKCSIIAIIFSLACRGWPWASKGLSPSPAIRIYYTSAVHWTLPVDASSPLLVVTSEAEPLFPGALCTQLGTRQWNFGHGLKYWGMVLVSAWASCRPQWSSTMRGATVIKWPQFLLLPGRQGGEIIPMPPCASECARNGTTPNGMAGRHSAQEHSSLSWDH